MFKLPEETPFSLKLVIAKVSDFCKITGLPYRKGDTVGMARWGNEPDQWIICLPGAALDSPFCINKNDPEFDDYTKIQPDPIEFSNPVEMEITFKPKEYHVLKNGKEEYKSRDRRKAEGVLEYLRGLNG